MPATRRRRWRRWWAKRRPRWSARSPSCVAPRRIRVYEERRVGRAGLPATVLGLIVHAAEHSTRHMGQALTTALILRGTS